MTSDFIEAITKEGDVVYINTHDISYLKKEPGDLSHDTSHIRILLKDRYAEMSCSFIVKSFDYVSKSTLRKRLINSLLAEVK